MTLIDEAVTPMYDSKGGASDMVPLTVPGLLLFSQIASARDRLSVRQYERRPRPETFSAATWTTSPAKLIVNLFQVNLFK